MLNPGDVVLLDFPGVQGVKLRPGVVVSSAAYHLVRPDVIVALCTSNLASAMAPTDYALQDWAAAGLRVPTAFRSFFVTLPAGDIRRVIGKLTAADWAEVQARLRIALAVT